MLKSFISTSYNSHQRLNMEQVFLELNHLVLVKATVFLAVAAQQYSVSSMQTCRGCSATIEYTIIVTTSMIFDHLCLCKFSFLLTTFVLQNVGQPGRGMPSWTVIKVGSENPSWNAVPDLNLSVAKIDLIYHLSYFVFISLPLSYGWDPFDTNNK